MKGIVFREFISLVETQFSLETADHIIAASHLSSDGAYTTVGTYPHQEMVELVTHLSEATKISVKDLLHHFGRHHFFSVFLRFIRNSSKLRQVLSNYCADSMGIFTSRSTSFTLMPNCLLLIMKC